MKVIRRPGEPVLMLVRRLKKYMERAGVFRELRTHSSYTKPCEVRRREKLRRQLLARENPAGK